MKRPQAYHMLIFVISLAPMKTLPTPQNLQHLLFTAFALIAVFVLCWGQQFSVTHYCPAKATVVADSASYGESTANAEHDCAASEQLLASSSVNTDFADVVLYAAALLIITALFYLHHSQRYREQQPPRPHPPYHTLYCSYLE